MTALHKQLLNWNFFLIVLCCANFYISTRWPINVMLKMKRKSDNLADMKDIKIFCQPSPLDKTTANVYDVKVDIRIKVKISEETEVIKLPPAPEDFTTASYETNAIDDVRRATDIYLMMKGMPTGQGLLGNFVKSISASIDYVFISFQWVEDKKEDFDDDDYQDPSLAKVSIYDAYFKDDQWMQDTFVNTKPTSEQHVQSGRFDDSSI